MKKILIGLAAFLLTAIFLVIGAIALYTNVPAFTGWVDRAVARYVAMTEPGEEALTKLDSKPSAAASLSGETNPPPLAEGTSEEDAAEEAPTEEDPSPTEPLSPDPTQVEWVPSGLSYLPPDISDLDVPRELQEKAGLTSAEEISKVVSDSEADQIESGMPLEPTGKDLSFDPMMYPYFHMLDADEQALYRQIYSHAKIRNAAFRSVLQEVTADQVQDAFLAVYYDHPELFWVDNTFYTFYRRNGNFIELDLTFNEAGYNYASASQQWGDAADSLLAAAYDIDDPSLKEKALHDALAAADTYRRNAPMNQSAYSAVVNHETVCAGYARAFQFLLQQYGIPCYLCVGYAGEPHAWNIVCLDGKYYNVDVTWDDTEEESGVSYDWYNRSDADYATTHIRQGLSVNLPPC